MNYLMQAKRKSDGIWIIGYYAKVKDYLDEKDIHVIIPTDANLIPHEDINMFEVIDESTLELADKQENMLCKCIYAWYKDGIERYDDMGDQEFVSKVCNALGFSYDEYKSLMFQKRRQPHGNKNFK